jgi:hypothetical protein
MKVKVAEVGAALHPSEVIVALKTISGTENLVIDRRSLQGGNAISVGFPIRQEGDNFLIELPRESQSGAWRVWVDSSQIEDAEERLRA